MNWLPVGDEGSRLLLGILKELRGKKMNPASLASSSANLVLFKEQAQLLLPSGEQGSTLVNTHNGCSIPLKRQVTNPYLQGQGGVPQQGSLMKMAWNMKKGWERQIPKRAGFKVGDQLAGAGCTQTLSCFPEIHWPFQLTWYSGSRSSIPEEYRFGFNLFWSLLILHDLRELEGDYQRQPYQCD